jgi:hypothetical protein
MPNGNITIDKGVITSQTDNPDGSISIKAQLPCSQDITLTATPNSGYTLEYIKKNGVAESGIAPAGDSIVFNSDGEPTINVRFKKNAAPPAATYKVRIETGGNTVRVQEYFGGPYYDFYDNLGNPVEYTVNAGATFAPVFSIRPADAGGFDFSSIAITKPLPTTYLPSVLNTQTYYYSQVINQDHTFIVYPKLKNSVVNYTLSTVVAGGIGGTATPQSQIVAAAGNANINIVPTAGYKIKSIFVNGFPNNSFPSSGSYSLPVNNINTNTVVTVTFELIGIVDIPAALISRIVYSRLIGSATQATAWSDSSYIDATPTYLPGGRRLFSNGIQVTPFNLPYNYAGTYLRTEVDFTTGDVAIDEFIDSQSNNYMRLAIDSIAKDGNDLKINTRLNNIYGNSGNGFSAGQVALCQLKVTNPDGVVTTFVHPVTTAGYRITDIMHSYTLTKVGVYILETETRLLSGNLKTSYGKTFVTVSPA